MPILEPWFACEYETLTVSVSSLPETEEFTKCTYTIGTTLDATENFHFDGVSSTSAYTSECMMPIFEVEPQVILNDRTDLF
jgi:hypothetical protein